jgi:hypothetical protein
MSGKSPDRGPRPGGASGRARSRVRGWARGLWPDHNPLRRATDRLEAGLVAGLLLLFLAGGPLTGLLAWNWAHGVGARAEQARHTLRYQVSAVLVADASYSAYTWSETLVRARWTAPDGTSHTGQIDAPVGLRRGAVVKIWTSRSGQVLAAPLRPDQVTSQAVLAAVIAPLVLGFVLVSVGTLARRVLDRRRLAAWGADWRATGPQWSRLR